jgi:16S rRNA (guanine966-N2)-methyltransferase
MRIVGGMHKGRKLSAPAGRETRPSTEMLREALFNICQHHIEGARFLDLFAGTGAVGLEALSRGAQHVTFVDQGREAIHSLKKNITSLGLDAQSTVIMGDALNVLHRLDQEHRQFDVIFADPPYEAKVTPKRGSTSSSYPYEVLKIIDASNLLSPRGIVFIEETASSLEKTMDLLKTTLTVLRLHNKRHYGRSHLWEFRPLSIHIELAE